MEILNIDSSSAQVKVNDEIFEVEIEKQIQIPKTPTIVRKESIPSTDQHPTKTSNPEQPKGGGYIKSPLPGVIVDVLINVGDKVDIGQNVLILEAMKMDNNIISDKSGKVIAIHFNKGDSVMEGDTLIVIE